jgi:hypothetical protein
VNETILNLLKAVGILWISGSVIVLSWGLLLRVDDPDDLTLDYALSWPIVVAIRLLKAACRTIVGAWNDEDS